MRDKVRSLFLSEKGKKIEKGILQAIEEYKMSEQLQRGVLVGFSGGADSVMLLCFLAHYSDFGRNFPVVALHVNHSIRGEEADRDEEFARCFCSLLGVEFISKKIDVPKLATDTKTGLEECARECRYLEFANIIRGRSDLSTVCVAHNADDNLETVILNLLRGAGTKGMAGIPPVRENIVRPLIYVTKKDIVDALREFSIDFVFDSTNADNDYKRNFIRNDVLPRLREISSCAEAMASRASLNLRVDDDYISSVAKEFLRSREEVENSSLSSLHEAVFARVLSIMAGFAVSFVNIRAVRGLLSQDNFSYSLGCGKSFLCEHGVCRVSSDVDDTHSDFSRELSLGMNSFDDFDADVFVSRSKVNDSFAKVYKISIQANLSSAIIKGDLYIRQKEDGDLIRYGGITRKLKKLFNDRKIPPSKRSLIPVICDDQGVVFVPGFGVRDDGVDLSERQDLYVFVGIGKSDELKQIRFHLGNEAYK